MDRQLAFLNAVHHKMNNFTCSRNIFYKIIILKFVHNKYNYV